MNRLQKIKFVNLFTDFSLITFLFLAPYFSKWAKSGIILLLFACLLRNFYLKKTNFFRNFLNRSIVFFLISAVLSTIFSINPYHSQSILTERFLLYILCFYIGANYIKLEKNVNFFILIFLLSGFIFGLGGVLYYFKNHPWRLFHSWGVNVDIGGFSVLFLPFSYLLFRLPSERKIKIIAGFSFLIMFITLAMDYSRGSFVSILGGLSITFFCYKKHFKKGFKEIVFLSIILISSLIIYCLLNPERLLDLGTFKGRFYYIEKSWKLFMSSPLIGKGLGTFELANVRQEGKHIIHVENLYMEILAQSGILGLISFLYIFWRYFKLFSCAHSIKPYQLAIAASVASNLINGFFASAVLVGVSVTFLFWFILGISVAEFQMDYS